MARNVSDMNDEGKIRRTKGSVVHPMTQRTLRKIGQDIGLARRARRMSVEDFSERAGISRTTLYRLEQGDPGVSLNTLVMALHVLGNLEKLLDVVDSRSDDVGLMLMRGDVPKRIVRTRPKPGSRGDEDVAPDSTDIAGW